MGEKQSTKIKGGARPGAGRKKGSPNKMTADLRWMVLGALDDAGGRKYLREQASGNPTAFLTLVGKCLPKEIVGDPERPLQHSHKVIWGA